MLRVRFMISVSFRVGVRVRGRVGLGLRLG